MVRMLENIGGKNYAGEDNYLIDVGGSEGVSGEVALWRAVITQALMDAGSNSTKREMRLDRAQAIAWLSGVSEDFKEVCVRAELNPDYVREKAKKAIHRGCAWRRETQAMLPKKCIMLSRLQQHKAVVTAKKSSPDFHLEIKPMVAY